MFKKISIKKWAIIAIAVIMETKMQNNNTNIFLILSFLIFHLFNQLTRQHEVGLAGVFH